MENKIV